MHGLRCIIASLKAHAHRCGIRLQAARLEDFKHLRNARLVADRRERIILRAPRLGRVFAGLAVDFVKLLGLRVIILPIAILDRPLGRHAVAMAERFKILFAQPEQRRAVNLRVAADVIGKAGPDFAAVLVEHHLGRIILERAVIIPIVLLTRQERPAFQHEDALAAGGEPMQQRPPARARADDDDVEMLVHDGSWSRCGGKPYIRRNCLSCQAECVYTNPTSIVCN